MDSFTGFDKTLPLDLNGTSNPDLLTEVTFGGLMEYPDGSVPMVAKTNTGRMSPVRGRTMKEYDQQIGELKKENFDLKLRIYFLEERLQQKFGDEDVFKTNIHLKVEAESLKKELEQRNEMLQKASETLNNLTQRYSDELEKQMLTLKQELECKLTEAEKKAEEAERDKDKFQKFLFELREEIADKTNTVQHLRDECKGLKDDLDNKNKALADKDNELTELSSRLEKTIKDLDNVKAQAQQTEEELRDQLEKERMNVGRKDRDMQRLSILVKERTNIDGETFLEKNHLQDEVEDKTKTLEKLRKKLDDQDRVGKRRETMLGNMEDLLREKEKERKDLIGKVESLQKELQGQKQDRQQMKKGTAILAEKLKEQTRQCERMSGELQSKNEELDKVRSELHLANLEKHKQRSPRTSYHRYSDGDPYPQGDSKNVLPEDVIMNCGEAEVNNHIRKEIEQLKSVKNELEDRIGGFEERISNQEAELERLVKSLGKKEGELEGFKDLLKRAEESLSQSESAVESLQQQLQKERAFRDREQNAQEVLDEKSEEIKQLKKKLKDLEGDMEEADSKHRKEVNNYKREIDDLQSQLDRKEHQYQLKLNELDSVAHKLDITVGTQGAHTLPELSQILEEIRNLKGSVGERNIRIDVNPGSYSHVYSRDADNNGTAHEKPPHGPLTSPHGHHTSRIPVRKGSGSDSHVEDLSHLKKLVSDLRAQNKSLDHTLQATEETVRVQTQKMKYYKNMLIEHGLLPKSISRSSSDPNLANWSPCLDRQSRQSSRYHSTDNLSRHRSLSPAPGIRNSSQNEDFQKLVKENEKLRDQIDGYKRVLKVFQDRASDTKDGKVDGHGLGGPQPISAESASCLLDNWLDMIDKFLLELSQGDQNGHMPVTASTTEVTRLRRGLVQARGAIQSLSHISLATQDGAVSSTGFQWSPESGSNHPHSNSPRSSSMSPTSSDNQPSPRPAQTFADSRFSVQHSEDQSLERLRHCSESTHPGPVSMVSDFTELDNSAFSSQTNANQRFRDISDDSLAFKVPPPKVTLSRVSEVSSKEQTLDLSNRLSPQHRISSPMNGFGSPRYGGSSPRNGASSPLNGASSPQNGGREDNEKVSPVHDNTMFGSIYEKTFSSSFIGSHQPHYHSINESAFESTHILEHTGSSEKSPDRGSQYEVDRLRSRLSAMEKLHAMLKNEMEIYRKVADKNKAQSDNPLLQHLEELRQTRLNLERELTDKQKDFETAKETELLKKQAKIQELSEIIIQLQKQFSDCQNTIHEKIVLINEKEKIISETNIVLSKERDKAKTDRHELESYRKKVHTLEQELRDSKATVAKVTEMMSKLKTALEQYKRREGQLEGDVRQHMEVSNKYQRAANELELKLKESKEFADQLTDGMEKLKEKVEELEEECKQCKISEEQYKTMLGEGRIKVCELSECVKMLNEEAQQKEAEIEELKRQIDHCSQTISSQVRDLQERDSIIENQNLSLREKDDQLKMKDQCVKEQVRQLEGQGAINTELSSRLEHHKKLCSEQSLTIDKQTKQIKDLENKLLMLEKSDSSKIDALREDFEKRLAKKNSDMRKILQLKEEIESKLTKCSNELQEVSKKKDKYLNNLKVVYPEYKRKCDELEDAVRDMKKYRVEWLRYQEQLEEMSDMNRTLKLEISVHETLSSEKPVSEGDRQYIIVQLLAEIKKLKELMEVYIERQKKQREEHQKLLDELNAQKKRFQVPEAMDGQPAPERPSPLGDQPDGGSINKETVIHTVRRDIEHRINLLESPDTTASSDSGNIDEPDQMGFSGNVTWPRDQDRISGELKGVGSLSSSLPLEPSGSATEKGHQISDTLTGSPGSFSIPGPLYKQGITDECLHYNVHDSPKFLARLTQIRIDSDDRTLFAVGMVDHFEKLQKEVNESHVILKGIATRVKERLKFFGTMPASESVEYSTLKELSLAAENMRICLEEEQSLVGCFWMSELPAPNEKGEFVNKKQLNEIRELKDELSSLQRKYKFMCEKMNSASQRLCQTNMQRMLSEEEIARSLQSTTEVISQARHNLEQSQKRRNSPKSSPRSTFKH